MARRRRELLRCPAPGDTRPAVGTRRREQSPAARGTSRAAAAGGLKPLQESLSPKRGGGVETRRSPRRQVTGQTTGHQQPNQAHTQREKGGEQRRRSSRPCAGSAPSTVKKLPANRGDVRQRRHDRERERAAADQRTQRSAELTRNRHPSSPWIAGTVDCPTDSEGRKCSVTLLPGSLDKPECVR